MYTNIPSIGVTYTDGNLGTVVTSSQPKVLILGTAASGRTDAIWQVTNAQTAVREFGNEGTLAQSMYEAMTQGADNVYLRRLPTGTSAVLANVCRESLLVEGITITTLEEDAQAGNRYGIWYDASAARLAIYDTEEEKWIYDSAAVLAIDLGRISVTGTIQTGSIDIGTQEAPTLMSAVIAELDAEIEASSATNFGITYTAGTDGVNPSRMELFEALLEVYQELDFQDVDFLVLPPKASVNAPNVVDGNVSEDTEDLEDYPDADSDEDILGRVFIQEYKHRLYFWWKMEENPNDEHANIYPVGIGYATDDTDIDDNDITSSDYHEVNFAWALAKFCKHASESFSPIIGFYGVERPLGFDRVNVANWIGEFPTFTEESDGTVTADDGGEGLLGIKFLAGAENYNDSLKDGGFLDTEDPYYLDGLVVLDSNDRAVDLGKYVVANCHWPILSNAWIDPNSPTGRSRIYVNSGVATMAGLYATLAENVEAAGTAGVLRGVRLDNMKIPATALDRLLGIRLNGMRTDSALGVILAGSKTSARPDSDYTKISTIRSVAKHVKGIMLLGRSLQGQPSDDLRLLGFKSQIETFLRTMQSQGYNGGYVVQVITSAADRRIGRVRILLTIVPPYCVEQITIEIALSE